MAIKYYTDFEKWKADCETVGLKCYDFSNEPNTSEFQEWETIGNNNGYGYFDYYPNPKYPRSNAGYLKSHLLPDEE